MEFLQFEDDGRTLTCRSAFRTEPTDTPENLRPRIVAHYAHLLAERARPRTFRPPWSGRPKAATPADPAS
jgi:hypothetical protein